MDEVYYFQSSRYAYVHRDLKLERLMDRQQCFLHEILLEGCTMTRQTDGIQTHDL